MQDCPTCGVFVRSRARFCPNCGKAMPGAFGSAGTDELEITLQDRSALATALADLKVDQIRLGEPLRSLPPPTVQMQPISNGTRNGSTADPPRKRRRRWPYVVLAVLAVGALAALARSRLASSGSDDADVSFRTSDLALDGAYTAVRGDFDGDGDGDVIWYGRGNRSDWLWTFEDEAPVETTLDVDGRFAAKVGDFDGNGSDDVAWYDPADGSDDVLWFSTGDGQFDQVPIDGGTSSVAVARDLDGDDVDDLLWRDNDDPTSGEIWFGNPDREFRRWHQELPGRRRVNPGDFDGDDRLDILWYANSGDPSELWSGVGDGTFQRDEVTLPAEHALRVGDFDGDGHDDLLLADDAGVQVLRGTDRGLDETTPVDLESIGSTPVVGDFNADGRDDLVVNREGRPRFLLGSRDLTFPPVDGSAGVLGQAIVFDVNGDGADDIYWYAPGEGADRLDVSQP